MKFIMLVSLLVLSTSVFSKCRDEAHNIAEEVMQIFNVNDQDFNCRAPGKLKSLKPLAVIAVMPPRYAYEAEFTFPCGPQPRSPKVTMLLNQRCKIVNLTISGHQL